MTRNFIIITLIIGAVSVVGSAGAQISPPAPRPNVGDLIAGEHTPLFFYGQGTIYGTAHPCTTAWIQIGACLAAEAEDNRNIGRYNPERFTLALKLGLSGAGDSAAVSAGRFEWCYDTTQSYHWNADSSNMFISTDAFNQADYGAWRFLPQRSVARGCIYPLRVWSGGYLRFILSSDIADTCSVNWRLLCEH